MANKQRFTKTEFRKTLEETGNLNKTAERLKVDRRTVDRYLERYEDMIVKPLRAAINDSGGHLGVIAGRLGVSRRTVYRWLEENPDLSQERQKEAASGRDEIVELAQTKLVEGLQAGDVRLIMFALRHYDKEGVPGAFNLDSLFSPDVAAYMRAQGVEFSDVVQEFEALMRAQAEKVSG